MALWSYTIAFPDGRRESRMLAAGNQGAARERAHSHARALGAVVEGEPVAVDSRKGSM
jgi:hypothetical protein